MSMDPHDDEDLRRAFAELRRADAQGAPSYEAVMARAARPRPAALAPVLASALGVGAVIAALAVGLAIRWTPPPSPSPVAMAAWTAPTDFLLRTPGSEILGSVPRFGLPRPVTAPDASYARPERRRDMP
jgi:hypothetical protein